MPKKKPVRKVSEAKQSFIHRLVSFFGRNKKHFAALSIIVITSVGFMWPMISQPATYSEGGDHMFNAWTLARNHYCLLRQGCPSYVDANIFFPNKDSMLFSETQLSAGILTLPLHFINYNPLFAANVWYFVSVLLSGVFMYFLALYLSKGNRLLSLAAGLVFQLGPNKFSSMSHLQNLSFFYIPLIILMLLKYRDTGQKKYLGVFGVSSALLFFASWYQMVFGLVIIWLFIAYLLFGSKSRAIGLRLLAVTLFAISLTLPLVLQYTRFSQSTNAGFSINSQIEFSASVNDYFVPLQDTPLGSLYYKVNPGSRRNSYNQDSYSYAGVSLYVIALFCLYGALRKKVPFFVKQKRFILLLFCVALAGFIISLGPVFKYGTYSSFPIQGIQASVPAPYIFVDLLLPQLSFIRAIGRAAVIPLFALCCSLSLFARYLSLSKIRYKNYLIISLFAIIMLDLLPISTIICRPFRAIPAFYTRYSVPGVYQYIKANPTVNNIIIVRTQKDYPGAGIPTAPVEDVLWAGYHNRNIFNGYSGYEPPEYKKSLQDFTDLQENDVAKLKSKGIRFYLIDKQLSSDNPDLIKSAQILFGKSVYQDTRYSLFEI